VYIPEEPLSHSVPATTRLPDGDYCACKVGGMRRQFDEYTRKEEEAEAKQSAMKETEAA
jgi:hypothetical protein